MASRKRYFEIQQSDGIKPIGYNQVVIVIVNMVAFLHLNNNNMAEPLVEEETQIQRLYRVPHLDLHLRDLATQWNFWGYWVGPSRTWEIRKSYTYQKFEKFGPMTITTRPTISTMLGAICCL